MLSPSSLLLLSASVLGLVSATSTPSSTTSPPPATTTYYQPGCPSKVSIANGDFETGKISPWTAGYLGGEGAPVNASIVSPGYKNSKYALQLDFTGNGYGYNVNQDLKGQVCFGYYYNISYAYNWVNYTGPKDYCSFSVYTGYGGYENTTTHNASRQAGWHTHSYVLRDEYSHCHPASDSLFFDLDCDIYGNKTVPPFALRLDNFKIETLGYSPVPYPDSGYC